MRCGHVVKPSIDQIEQVVATDEERAADGSERGKHLHRSVGPVRLGSSVVSTDDLPPVRNDARGHAGASMARHLVKGGSDGRHDDATARAARHPLPAADGGHRRTAPDRVGGVRAAGWDHAGRRPGGHGPVPRHRGRQGRRLRRVLHVHGQRDARRRRDGPALRQGRPGRGSGDRRAPPRSPHVRPEAGRRLALRRDGVRGHQGGLGRGLPGRTPTVLGLPLKVVAAGNRYGLPEFYQRHVWLWRNNPSGMFEDWNPSVSCRGTGDPA